MPFPNKPPPIFEVFDSTLAESLPEIAGIWKTRLQQPPPADMSFAPGQSPVSPPVQDIQVWRVNLTEDVEFAATQLRAGVTRLVASEQAMKTLPQRIAERVVQTREAGQSFSVGSLTPEEEVLQIIHQLQPMDASVSFGLKESLSGGWQQTVEQFQKFSQKMLQTIVHYAWIETCVREQCLARTAVGWTGDMNTVWHHKSKPEQIALHQQTLTLALQSRNTLVRSLVTAIRGVTQISMVLTNPASAVLLLPTVWKLVNQGLKET